MTINEITKNAIRSHVRNSLVNYRGVNERVNVGVTETDDGYWVGVLDGDEKVAETRFGRDEDVDHVVGGVFAKLCSAKSGLVQSHQWS